jgi:selenide,water dikinase
VLRRLEMPSHPDLLVGTATSDDAAVWRLDADRALVVTADFITPIVDDPWAWGRIAAANSVSDVYAMGGRPILGLNLVGWNTEELGTDILLAVLQGAADAAAEGGWITVGGHTVEDPEPKFGMAVVGDVHPDRILTNAGLRPGDSLVLTKALGAGIVTTALKAGRAPDDVRDAAVASMSRLNREAAAIAVAAGATGATDITGFGLLGHLRSMAEASKVDVALDAGTIPMLPGVPALVAAGLVPGGSRRNLTWVAERLDADGIDEAVVIVLADAQTSGGLLFGAEPGRAAEAAAALRDTGHAAAVVGTVVAGSGRIRIRH